jgi:hypothetical protein
MSMQLPPPLPADKIVISSSGVLAAAVVFAVAAPFVVVAVMYWHFATMPDKVYGFHSVQSGRARQRGERRPLELQNVLCELEQPPLPEKYGVEVQEALAPFERELLGDTLRQELDGSPRYELDSPDGIQRAALAYDALREKSLLTGILSLTAR